MEKTEEKRVLVVDDERDVTELLEYKLKQAGMLVRALNDPLRVIGMARDLRPDLIILDVMMPDLTGIQLLRMIRADALLQDTPVMFLTAKGETEDRLKGLEGGADDYLAKPFDPRELVLRAQALLRRAKSAAAKPDSRLAAGPVVIDLERHEVTVGGKVIDLTATEFKLLRTLVERKGRVQTRDRLLADVWNYSPDLETRTVDTHMRRLREKLGRAGEVIETIRGVGYRAQG
jgi:two-component system phosphate regulon response regulator PhoB